MQSTVTYNGRVIKDVLTEPITVTPVKNQAGTDQLGIEVRFACTGVVHMSSGSHTGLRVPSLAVHLDDVIRDLSKDRRPFQWKIGNSIVYDIRPGAVEPGVPSGGVVDLQKMDVNHGPRPTVTVMSVVAGYSAKIRFECVFMIPNTEGRGDRTSLSKLGLLNFTFHIVEDIDGDTFLTRRTYAGVLRVLHKNINPHALARVVAFPPLQRGFRRRVVNLAESENGLEMSFVVEDQEVAAAAPWYSRWGATSWKGAFQLSTSSPNISTVSELNLSLTGPKSTSKVQLLDLAMKVVEAKTHALTMFKNQAVYKGTLFGSAFLEQFAVREELASNEISVVCRIRHTATRQQLLALFAPGGTIGIGPLPDMGIGYDPDVSFLPAPTATLTGLFLSALQMPNRPASMPRRTDTPPKDAQQSRERTQRSSSSRESQLATEQSRTVSKDHVEAQYLDYELNSDLVVHSGRIALGTGAAASPKVAPVAVVSLHRPWALRVVDIDACRINQPPTMPNFNTDFVDVAGVRHAAIGDPTVQASAPQLSADSRSLLYRVLLHQEYALDRIPSAGVPVGAVPYRATSFTDPTRKLPSQFFVSPRNILG